MVQFVRSRKGNPLLLDSAGYLYTKSSSHKNSTYWACLSSHIHHKDKKDMKCFARVVTDAYHITKYTAQHNHLPPDDRTWNKYN